MHETFAGRWGQISGHSPLWGLKRGPPQVGSKKRNFTIRLGKEIAFFGQASFSDVWPESWLLGSGAENSSFQSGNRSMRNHARPCAHPCAACVFCSCCLHVPGISRLILYLEGSLTPWLKLWWAQPAELCCFWGSLQVPKQHGTITES